MIGTLPTETKIIWQEQLSTLIHAYNCSHSNATGFSSFYLMFRRHPILPIDVQFGVRTPDIVVSTSHGYIQKFQRRLDWAYKTANVISQKESECSKKWYDQNVKALSWNQEILSWLDKKLSKGSIKSVIDGKIPLVM